LNELNFTGFFTSIKMNLYENYRKNIFCADQFTRKMIQSWKINPSSGK